MILKVKQNENPYDVIGNYIEKHIPVIDDIIAVISIDGEICNELLLVDGEIGSTNNFVWQIDWWEGEENVELIDFFFVSDACKKNNNNDLISKKQAIRWVKTECNPYGKPTLDFESGKKVIEHLEQMSPAQPEQTNCDYYHKDVDSYVKPIEKNSHAFIRFGMNGWELELKVKGWYEEAKIQYCPMCGRKLKNDK